MRWIVPAFFAVYIVLALRFFSGQPHPTVDYIAILNAKTLQTPESDRAWPIYRRAILLLTDRSSKSGFWPDAAEHDIHGKHWPETVAYLHAHQAGLALFREASTKPIFGWIFGPEGSQNDPELGCRYINALPTSYGVLDGSLFDLKLTYISEMRYFLLVARADIQLATEEHDADRAEKDLIALLDMTDQLHRQHALGNNDDSRSIIYRGWALTAAQNVLQDHPDLWTDATLTRIAHRLSRLQKPADLLSYEDNRLILPDILQRTYTDDGHGNGRLTFAGASDLAKYLRSMHGIGPEYPGDKHLVATGPLLMAASLSRRDMLNLYNQIIDRNEASLQMPLRFSADANQASDAKMERWNWSHEMEEWNWSPLLSVRYYLINALAPVTYDLPAMAETQLGVRDGLIIGIALELYHRHHGRYPDTLAELTPDFLPEVPADRITGDPVRYRLVNGTPLVYSVGADRHDDGGRLTYRYYDDNAAAQWGISPAEAKRGDWILYPQRGDADNYW